ncbi:hypothetical protein EDD70_0526 [Hydrogenoanaerobacterium saccharovorans]|uniref:Uncharacterized protein n=1 Tax=Hydrogenoanaerobacterium saccharovorans TaxID=474960 RepID=A0A1H8AVD0_9FIRM|nr:hypothetical protein [Hydrogenoanaerobacterium saccharovorans]RPF47727.1 hypothetical protein EDD70_0526 [Hydrogenoanaerobacterium saccharovorans]SEM74680.1 hypothetical protein SAMN05216180_1565 [Hydrogenoanaerobacterium saccharovorans]
MEDHLLATERNLDMLGRLVLPPLYRKTLGFEKDAVNNKRNYIYMELNIESKEIKLTNANRKPPIDSVQSIKRCFDNWGRLMLPPNFKEKLGIHQVKNATLRLELNTITKEVFITNPHRI